VHENTKDILHFLNIHFLFEQDVLQTGKLQAVLTDLRQIVHTPIKVFNPPPGIPTTVAGGNNNSGVAGAVMEQPGAVSLPPHPEDLPSWITRVMGKGNLTH
jgi:hypothetical protein